MGPGRSVKKSSAGGARDAPHALGGPPAAPCASGRYGGPARRSLATVARSNSIWRGMSTLGAYPKSMGSNVPDDRSAPRSTSAKAQLANWLIA
jgi:hypothetical protein